MEERKPDTRQRILDASGELFRLRGFAGTGLKQISEASRAPFGSVYHFFPGGKEQLAAESLRESGERYRQLVERVFDAAPDPVAGIYAAFVGAGETMRATDFEDACPIATVAAEVASTNESLRVVTAAIFESWIESGTERLAAAGIDHAQARSLMIYALAALEGAFILSRAAKSTEPMETTGRFVAETIRRHLP